MKFYCHDKICLPIINLKTTMDTQILFQGAESKIYIQDYLGKKMLVKERFIKHYRHPQLDTLLTKERIKAECRNIVRAKKAGLRTPTIYLVDMDKRMIYMEYIENSITVKQLINQLQADTTESAQDRLEQLIKDIGIYIGKLHKFHIIHGDLTTSNILVADNKIIFIDFGLSSSSGTATDKGVDLYVLERALISTHSNAERLFDSILKSYAAAYGAKDALVKFEDVRARGRKRTMVG